MFDTSVKKRKYIGGGIEFNVYEYSKNRVIKFPTYSYQIALKLIIWEPLLLFNLKTFHTRVIKVKESRFKSIAKIDNSQINKKIFGDFELNNDSTLIQDRAIILKHYLNKDKNQSRLYISKYIETLFELWKYGLSDTVFNITINNGLNTLNEVIFVDVGEIHTNKNYVIRDILSQKWLSQYSYRFQMNNSTKKIFEEQMEKNVTLENLEKYWRENI